jgi:glutamate-1-semialdehyde 2,1-aminomutase
VVDAICRQAKLGTSYGACHSQEVELADWILKGLPFLEKVRLVNSGTEAVMTAVRLARAVTRRSKIIQFEGCYHGHSDGFLAKAGSGIAHLSEATSQGVPQGIVNETLTCSFRSIEDLKRQFEKFPNEIAAIVLEPIPANHGLFIPSREHLNEIVSIAHTNGALVIFDEVISGFRIGLSGACGFYDLKPDIVTLGKIIGGGLPLAAIASRSEIIDHLAPLGGVYQAGTLSGNPLAVAAGCAVLKEVFSVPPI